MSLIKKVLLYIILLLGLVNLNSIFAINTSNSNDIAKTFVAKLETMISKYDTPKQLSMLKRIRTKLYDVQSDLNSIQMEKYDLESCDSICKTRISDKITYYNEVFYSISSDLYLLEQKLKQIDVEELFKEGESTYTDKEAKKVEESILKLQKLMFDKMYDKYLNYVDVSKSCNYEQKGKINGSVTVNNPNGEDKMDLMFKLDDFLLQTNCKDLKVDFDSEASFDIINSGGKSSMSLKTLLSMISKDNNNYLKINDLSIDGNMDNNTDTTFFKNLKQLDVFGKFVKLPIGYPQEQTIILNKIKEILVGQGLEKLYTDSYFRLYKKDGDKYYILPNKLFCNRVKSLEAIDRGSIDYCDDQDYQYVIGELISNDAIPYIKYDGNDTILGLNAKDNQGKIKIEIIYNNIIKIIKASIFPISEEHKGQGITFEYEYNKKLDFWINIDEGEGVLVDFKSKISDDRFVTIDSYIKLYQGDYYSDEKFEIMNGYLKLKDHIIDGEFKIKNYDSSYGSEKAEVNFEFKGDVSGKTDSRDRLQLLDLQVIGTDLVYNKQVVKFDLELEKSSGELKSGLFALNIDYVGGMFDLNLELKDKIIKGYVKTEFGGALVLDSQIKGEYYKDYFMIENDFKYDMSQTPYAYYSKDNLQFNGNFKLKSDTRYNNQNGLFEFVLNDAKDNTIVRYLIDASFIKELKSNINISAPSDYGTLEEAMKIEVDLDEININK